MRTYLSCLLPLWQDPADPGWYWGQCSAEGPGIEVGTPVDNKASLELLPALQREVPAAEAP